MPLPPWGPLLFPWRLTAGGFELSRGKCFPYIVIQLHPQEGEEEVGRVVLFPFSLWSGTRKVGEQGSLLIKRLACEAPVQSLFLMSLKKEVTSLLPWRKLGLRGAERVSSASVEFLGTRVKCRQTD